MTLETEVMRRIDQIIENAAMIPISPPSIKTKYSVGILSLKAEIRELLKEKPAVDIKTTMHIPV